MSTLVAALAGLLLGGLSVFMVVQAVDTPPEPVSQPLVVYGER